MRKVSQPLMVGLFFLVTLGILFLAQSNTISREQIVEPATTPPPAEISEEEYERLLEEQEVLAKQMLERPGIRQVSGPQTAGSIIHINGKEIRLRNDVYVEDLIATISCVSDIFCPDGPFYALRIQNTNDRIGVVIKDGTVVDDQHAPSEQQVRTRQKFQWLIDELERKE